MMAVRRTAALLVLAVAAATGATASGSPAKSPRLVAFRSCGDLLGYVKSQAGRLVGPYGLGAAAVKGVPVPAGAPARGAAPVQGVDYSGTNVQEQGVDEPDLVKTDGRTLFAVANGRLNSVDVREGRPRLLD